MSDAQETFGEEAINPETGEIRRAISSAHEAYQVTERIMDHSDERNKKNSKILEKFNDEPPYKSNVLKAKNQSWRSNRPTGFMSGFINRGMVAFRKPVDDARYITYSALPSTNEKDIKATQVFREETTKCIRRWEGWAAYLDDILLELLLFGYAADGFLDEYDWRPKAWRYDECYIPNDSKSSPEDIPAFVVRQEIYPHDLASRLSDPKASMDAGWDLDEIIKAINAAQSKDTTSGTEDDLRKYQDAYRENSITTTFGGDEIKVVKVRHLFVRELTGKISHYMLEEKGKGLLFMAEDKYDNMKEALRLHTSNTGNGKYYGSKGLGKVLYNSHVVADRVRNAFVDNAWLSGFLIITGDTSGSLENITVSFPFMKLPDGSTIDSQKFDASPENFKAIEEHITQIAEKQVGVFMPDIQMTGPVRTASEVNYNAAIEQAMKEYNVNRFFRSIQRTIFEMQKRIFAPENILRAVEIHSKKERSESILGKIKGALMAVLSDSNKLSEMKTIDEVYGTSEEHEILAIDAIINILERGVDTKTIIRLAYTSPEKVIDELFDRKAQIIAGLAAKYAGSPFVDQQKLVRKDFASQIGEEEAADLVIGDQPDPTVAAEQQRQQLIENASLLSGEQIPVSPRDNHLIHLKTMVQALNPLVQGLTPEALGDIGSIASVYQAIRDHGMTHIDLGLQAGTDPKLLEPIQQVFAQIDGLLGKAGASLEEESRAPVVQPAVRGAQRGGQIPQESAINSAEESLPQTEDIAGITRTKPLSRGAPNVNTSL